MLDPERIDLDMLATALGDQDGASTWYLDPRTGDVRMWSTDFGWDGDEEPDDADAGEDDLVAIDPVPSYVWYRHMVEFTESVPEPAARVALEIALDGKGAFRRFKNVLHERFPELLPAWRSHQQQCERRVALDWLADMGLISAEHNGAPSDPERR